MFGGHAFGAVYFGGAPRTGAKSITGSAACTLAPAICSGTGTVPQHGGAEPAYGGGGFAFLPFRKPKRTMRGAAACAMHPPTCSAGGMRKHNRRGGVALYISSALCSAVGRNPSADARDTELLSLGLALPDDF